MAWEMGAEQMYEPISVILINYNGKKYNNKCISSILSSSIADFLKIIIVDNASTDDSLSNLYQTWGNDSRIHIISLKENGGFSKANNIGIKWASNQGYHYFLLLNNDTEIHPKAIEEMFLCQKNTNCIIVPKILYADHKNVIWCAGGRFSPVTCKPFQNECGKTDNGQADANHPCTLANGCCLLLTDEIINEIGFLDERFFLYYEDTEYSLRAYNHRVGIYYCGKAIVYHKVNGSTDGNRNPANAYYITRNWLLCNKIHNKNKCHFILFCIYFFLNRLAWILIWLLQHKISMVKAVIKGIDDFKTGTFGKYKYL